MAPDGYALIGCEALIRDFKQQDNGLLGIRVEAVAVSVCVTPGCRRTSCWWPRCNGWKNCRTRRWKKRTPTCWPCSRPAAEHPMVASRWTWAPTPMASGAGQSAGVPAAVHRGRQDRPAATRRPTAAAGCDPDAARRDRRANTIHSIGIAQQRMGHAGKRDKTQHRHQRRQQQPPGFWGMAGNGLRYCLAFRLKAHTVIASNVPARMSVGQWAPK